MFTDVHRWQEIAFTSQLELHAQSDRLRSGRFTEPDWRLERLTCREWEILCLIVARCSDREIAESLCISYRTVTSHVTHIFNKLDVCSRRDAATVATRGFASTLPASHA